MSSGGSFDEQLRQALARVEPPEGFTDRVLAKVPRHPMRHRLLYGAIAAGLAVLAAFGTVEHNRSETRRRAQNTERQIVFALALAADKLDQVNARLRHSASHVQIDSN